MLKEEANNYMISFFLGFGLSGLGRGKIYRLWS